LSNYAYYNADPSQARFFASNNLVFPADGFHALGGFDTTFRTSEDRDLCNHGLHHGYHMTYAPEVIVSHAHVLTLRTFWQQHFNYGRGAFRYHRARARRGSGFFGRISHFTRSCLPYCAGGFLSGRAHRRCS
jgi:GT2 family glycosyltransferase